MTSDPPGDPPPFPEPGAGGGDPLVGTVLAGRYRIVRKLGEGGMGAVYLGEHIRFGRLDAIKLLRDSMSRDPEATERFLRGARNASAIQHENVCTVYDFSDAEGGLQFLAMEYVEGDTLADELERHGPLPVGRALALMRQVAAALGAAHELGIVHRDLKPGNVMLAPTRDGGERVKVVDFDIAKGSVEGEGRDVTRAGFVVGTPEYMSPEQLMGDPLDGRSDLYSLGIVLFRTLTGSIPSRAESTQDLMVERLTADPLRLADVAPDRAFPPALQELLDRLLQRRREDRYASAREVTEALDAVAAGGRPPLATRAAQPPTPDTPGLGVPQAPAAGGGRRAVLAVVGGAAVVAVVAWAALRDWGEPAATNGASVGPELTAADSADARADTVTIGGVDPAGADSARIAAGGADDRDPTGGSGAAVTGRSTDTVDRGRATSGDGGRSSIDVAAVEDLLFRQLDLLDPGAGAGAATRRVAEDSARMVYEHAGVGTADRALAAYVLGSLIAARGDTAEAVAWLTRAVDLAPGAEGYRTLLVQLRGGGG